MKSVRIWSFSGPYFPAIGLNTESLVRMRENTDQKNTDNGHFSHSAFDPFKALSILYHLKTRVFFQGV